jgi:hypothetical protein
MAKFGNGGSIILIASMSGSITNRVSMRGGKLERIAGNLMKMLPCYRTMPGFRTTVASLPFCKWLEVWLASLASKISA